MTDGLKNVHREAIIAKIAANRRVERAVLFGSRATGTNTVSSDVDIALFGDRLTLTDQARLAAALDEIPMAQSVDLILHHSIQDRTMREHIRRQGIAWYERPPTGPTTLQSLSAEYVRLSRLCLEEVANVTMGQSPHGETVSSRDGVPLLNGPTEFGAHHPHPVQFTTDPRRCAQPGDLLFCVRGSTTGRMNWADRKYAIGRGVAAIRHRQDLGLQPFVRAVIEFELPTLLAHATGSTFPNVSSRQLAQIPCPIFAEDEQRAIAHILGTLDDKIELYRRTNETLEAMAQALFKSWFVDFDPVRTKLEGRDTSLRQDIADLFPDRLVDSKLGWVPEGWEVFRLNELTHHHTRSTSPFRSPELEYEHFSIPAYDADQRPVFEPGAAIRSNKTVVPDDAVLLSKLNPRIARIWMPPDSTGRPQVCSTEFLAFTPKPPANRSLLFALFADQRFRALLKSLVTGTSKSHQRVPPKALKTQDVLAGSRRLFAVFGEATGGMLTRILKNRSEAATLATLRDTLLPKLISGEIRVQDAERALESVT